MREGIHSIFTHRLMSFAAMSVITACLLLMGSFTLVATNIDRLLGDIEEKNKIVAFVEDTYTEEDLAYYTGGRCDQEQDDPDVRPVIANPLDSIDQYSTILIGHPIWHGQAPRIISTFLESYDFSGRTMTTFCTSMSSGLGSSASNLYPLVSDTVTWLESRRFPAGAPREDIAAWLDEIGVSK